MFWAKYKGWGVLFLCLELNACTEIQHPTYRSIPTICPKKNSTCKPSEMRCPSGYLMSLGCGGCTGTPQKGVTCIPDFSNCKCLPLEKEYNK